MAQGAAQGDATALRRAVADLGLGLEHRLHSGDVPGRAPLRALLVALAEHPGADPALARAASALADGIAAQPLAAAASASAASGAAPLPSPAAADPSQNGAYLQLPLPGGGSAEVRVNPDAGRDGEGGDRPRRLAFLLHLSALGPVMIDATAGSSSVEMTVRATGEPARAFLGERSGELAEALGQGTRAARVNVERLAGPAPERLIPPPPSSGLDLSA